MCHFGDIHLITWLAVFAMTAHFRTSGNLKKCNKVLLIVISTLFYLRDLKRRFPFYSQHIAKAVP